MADNGDTDIQDKAEGGVPDQQQQDPNIVSGQGIDPRFDPLGGYGPMDYPAPPVTQSQPGQGAVGPLAQGQQLGMNQPPAPPPPPPRGGFFGGGKALLEDIARGIAPGLMKDYPPVGTLIQQKHGGLVTGLVGVLMDGILGGMSPDSRTAMQIPYMRQQAQIAQQEQQQKNLQLQLNTAKLQEELRDEPNREAAQMMDTMIKYHQLQHMFVKESDERATGMSDAVYDHVQDMIAKGGGKELMRGSLKQVMDYVGQEAQKSHHRIYPVITGHTDDGTPTEAMAFELDDDPNSIDEKPAPFTFTTSDGKQQTIKFDSPMPFKTEWDAKVAAFHAAEVAADRSTKLSESELEASLEKEALEHHVKPVDYQPWKDWFEAHQKLGGNKPTTQTVTPRNDIFGKPVGQLPSGDWAYANSFNTERNKFITNYIVGKNGTLPLLNSAERLQQIVDKITVRDSKGNPITDPKTGRVKLDVTKLTGADSITGLFDAVGVTMSNVPGGRANVHIIEGHEHARGWLESIRAAIQPYIGHGGPATPQQLYDYEDIMSQALLTAYTNAIEAATTMGPEGSNLDSGSFLPKGHGAKPNPNSALDKAIMHIYTVGADGDVEAAIKAMQANGWNMGN